MSKPNDKIFFVENGTITWDKDKLQAKIQMSWDAEVKLPTKGLSLQGNQSKVLKNRFNPDA